MENARLKGFSRRRNKTSMRRGPDVAVILGAAFLAIYLSGCVRVAGTAGYWHTDPAGDTVVKQTGFDTAGAASGNSAPGSIKF